MSKKVTRKALSIIMMLAIVMSAIPGFSGSAAETDETILLEGSVQDENGFAVPLAAITIVNIHTGEIYTDDTTLGGFFSFSLPEGAYVVISAKSEYVNFEGNGTSDIVMLKSGDKKVTIEPLILHKVPGDAEKITIKGNITRGANLGLNDITVQFRCIDDAYWGYTVSTITGNNPSNLASP